MSRKRPGSAIVPGQIYAYLSPERWLMKDV